MKIKFQIMNLIVLISMILLIKSQGHHHKDLEDIKDTPIEDIKNTNTLLLSFQSQNSIYIVEKDKEIKIQIRGNLTTGYGWYIDLEHSKNNKNNNSIEFLNLNNNDSTDDYKTDAHEPGYVGVGGMYTFKLKIKQPGMYTVNFLFKRPWETEPISFMSASLKAE